MKIEMFAVDALGRSDVGTISVATVGSGAWLQIDSWHVMLGCLLVVVIGVVWTLFEEHAGGHRAKVIIGSRVRSDGLNRPASRVRATELPDTHTEITGNREPDAPIRASARRPTEPDLRGAPRAPAEPSTDVDSLRDGEATAARAPSSTHERKKPSPDSDRAASDVGEAEDDLRKVHGIGPKIAALLRANGISTFARLAETDVAHLEALLARVRYRVSKPNSWPAQARKLAADE